MLRSGRGRCSRSYTGHPAVDLASDVGQVDGGKGEVGAGPEPNQDPIGGKLVGIELGYGFGGSWGLFPQSIPR